jgi:hypothetical protein
MPPAMPGGHDDALRERLRRFREAHPAPLVPRPLPGAPTPTPPRHWQDREERDVDDEANESRTGAEG